MKPEHNAVFYEYSRLIAEREAKQANRCVRCGELFDRRCLGSCDIINPGNNRTGGDGDLNGAAVKILTWLLWGGALAFAAHLLS